MRRRAAIVVLGVFLVSPPASSLAADDGSRLVLEERLGGLQVGLPSAQLKIQLGVPTQRGQESFSPATGEYEERWEYPAQGLVLTLSGSKGQGSKSVVKIEASQPSRLATRRGIHLGTPVADVKRAYSAEQVKDNSGSELSRFVAGSRYGGIIFDIAAGKVCRIYIGPFAE